MNVYPSLTSKVIYIERVRAKLCHGTEKNAPFLKKGSKPQTIYQILVEIKMQQNRNDYLRKKWKEVISLVFYCSRKKPQEEDTRCPFTFKLIKKSDVVLWMPDFYRTKSISIDFTLQALVHLYASVYEPLQSITPPLLSVQYWKYALEIKCSK